MLHEKLLALLLIMNVRCCRRVQQKEQDRKAQAKKNAEAEQERTPGAEAAQEYVQSALLMRC